MGETVEQLIIDSLNKINIKLDKHDESFGNINNTLAKLVAVDIEIREIKSSVGRVFDRVEVLEEDHKNKGCSVFRSFTKVREEQIKTYDANIEILEKKIGKVEDKVAKIENVPNRILFGAIVAAISTVVSGLVGYLLFSKGISK